MDKMKQISWLLYMLLLLIFACGKEKFQIKNSVSAKVNGVDWSDDNLIVHGTYRENVPVRDYSKITLKSYVPSNDGSPGRTDYLEILSFRRVNLSSLEKQTIDPLSEEEERNNTSKLTANYFLADYDLQLRDYEVLEVPGIESWIKLDKIKKNTISGRFEVAFRVTRGATNWIPINRSDTLYFTEGRFELVPYPE